MVLPEGVRLTELRVQFRGISGHTGAFGERERESVSRVLARELDGMANAHAKTLLWVVAGFADALAWPDDGAQLPC